MEFFSHFEPKDSKWFRASVVASQGLVVLFAAFLLAIAVYSKFN